MTSIDARDRRRPGRTLAFAGSARRGSWNALLLGIAVRQLRADGMEVTEVSLRDYALPLYDADLEESDGMPAGGSSLRRLIHEHDALLIGCPEYNGSVTPLLKNALDWCSRPSDGMGGLDPFRMKPALIVGTSVGPFGGLRAIGHLRAILSKMGAAVLPEDLAVPNAQTAFLADALADRGAADMLRRLTELLASQSTSSEEYSS